MVCVRLSDPRLRRDESPARDAGGIEVSQPTTMTRPVRCHLPSHGHFGVPSLSRGVQVGQTALIFRAVRRALCWLSVGCGCTLVVSIACWLWSFPSISRAILDVSLVRHVNTLWISTGLGVTVVQLDRVPYRSRYEVLDALSDVHPIHRLNAHLLGRTIAQEGPGTERWSIGIGYGFPFVCMAFSPTPEDAFWNAGVPDIPPVEIRRTATGVYTPMHVFRRDIPTLVVWGGLFLNVAAWTVFSLIVYRLTRYGGTRVQSGWRRRHGLCEHCGYPTGQFLRCPECGEAYAQSSKAR